MCIRKIGYTEREKQKMYVIDCASATSAYDDLHV